jgi:hypothetical protein
MFRDAVIGILAAVAKQARIRLSERTIAGLEHARAQGHVGADLASYATGTGFLRCTLRDRASVGSVEHWDLARLLSTGYCCVPAESERGRIGRLDSNEVLLNMAEDNIANRSEWVPDDRVGKSFTVIFANGDLPTNPMSLRECMVCGGVFTRDESREHSDARCQPSPEQPFAAAGRNN